MVRARLLLLFVLLPLAASARKHPDATLPVDTAVVRFLRDRLDIPFCGGNSVTLLPSGRDKYDDMFAAIRQARHYVHMEYFNFRADSIGQATFDLLCSVARRGVKVRVVFDSWGNKSNDRPISDEFVDSVRRQGVEIYEFDRMRFPWINHAYHRDHTKIVVIDGAMAYAGGMNVADYYIHGKPEFGKWRDMHFRLEGPSVHLYEELFAFMWRKVSRQRLDSLGGRVMTPLSCFTGLRRDTSATTGSKLVGVAERVPLDKPAIMRDAMIAMIDAAKERIVMVHPYFTPVRQLTRAIKRALRRGVQVDIMVSEKCDIPMTPNVVAYRVDRLRKSGANVFYYQDGFHHTKIMMVDGKLCTIGSTNFNSRSLCFDYEVSAFIIDPATTAELQAIFDRDLSLCTQLTDETKPRLIPKCKKFKGWLASILTPLI